MSNEIQTLDLSSMLPADALGALANIDAAQAALFDSFGGGATFLSIKGREFHLSEGGTKTTLEARRMDMVVVAARPTDHRLYYAGSYNPDAENVPPTCWSSDNVTPDMSVPASARQALKCADCPQNMKGSGGKDDAKACSRKRRAIILRADDTEHTPIVADLNALTIYKKGESKLGLFNFNEVVRQFATFQKKHNNLKTFCFVLQASFTQDSVPVLQFSFKDQQDPAGVAPRIADKSLIMASLDLWTTGEVERLLDMNLGGSGSSEDSDTTATTETANRTGTTMADNRTPPITQAAPQQQAVSGGGIPAL